MKTTNVKWFFTKMARLWMLILFSMVIVVLLAFALNHWVAYSQGDVVIEASGRTDMNFRVHYVENNIFPNNPIPQNLHFLMSFTEYIEVESGFFAKFSEKVAVEYSYIATKRLVIRHMGTGDGNQNPIVFEESTLLSEVMTEPGRIITTRCTNPRCREARCYIISFSIGESNSIGGTYSISLKEYIKAYQNFITAQAYQLETENVIAQNLRGFSAELFIDFTYMITVPAWLIPDGENDQAFTQSITRGYRLPLSTEVYSFIMTGNPTFERSEITMYAPQITMLGIMIFVLVFALSAYRLFNGIKKLLEDPNKRRQEALTIFKKYANEIIESDTPLPLSRYVRISVKDFESLLKLVIDLNKHIMCYHNDEYVEFAVIVDDYAYYFRIDHNEENDSTVEETITELTKVTS